MRQMHVKNIKNDTIEHIASRLSMWNKKQ